MCGIAGIAYADPRREGDQPLLAQMAARLEHRGPDDVGTQVGPGYGLTMRRLAVIDVLGGAQPISTEDGEVTVILNGEIYNFRELRRELAVRGHRFSSDSDTEVIAHLYEEMGPACVERLHGMFGIAIWDHGKRRLVLARDRLGVKPLHYTLDGERLLFASEIKSLLCDPGVERRVNLEALDSLLRTGHISEPETCFEDIVQLPPATTLIYEQGRLTEHRYWDLDLEEASPYVEAEAAEELLHRLRSAVARRLVSDVPIGAFLSGGIDSSVTVALMAELVDRPVRTFSIGFDDPSFSELSFARKVAEHFGTDHHEFVVKPDVAEILPDLIRFHDAPFYDTSAIPTYHLSRLAREHVTVALAGDGGDEMFAGYNVYRANAAARVYRRIPRPVRRLLIEPASRLVPETSTYINRGRVLREFIKAAELEPLERFARWCSKVKVETRDRLYEHPRLRECLAVADADLMRADFDAHPRGSELNRLLYVGMKRELAGDMLVKVDRMSMAHGLEVRSPLLDHTLFEYAARLPDRAKVRGRETKVLLKKVARSLLPEGIVDRPKRGFSVPLDRWLRTDLSQFTRDVLTDPRTRRRGLFRTRTVDALIKEHGEGRVARGRELWTLLTIELWHRMYVDADGEIGRHAHAHALTAEAAR